MKWRMVDIGYVSLNNWGDSQLQLQVIHPSYYNDKIHDFEERQIFFDSLEEAQEYLKNNRERFPYSREISFIPYMYI